VSRVAIIPARGGSTRIPGKNIREFHGRPILEYSIDTALRSGLFDAGVWVSTEDPKIARVAWAAGAKLHPRQMALAENDVGTQEVMRAVLLELYPPGGTHALPEFACCIYATAPLMTVADLRMGFALVAAGIKQYVFSTGYEDAGQWYWGKSKAFVDGIPLEGNSLGHLLPAERVCDINVEADWRRAEQLYTQLHGGSDG